MLEKRPGAYIQIGNGEGAGGCEVHNPGYDFNEPRCPSAPASTPALSTIAKLSPLTAPLSPTSLLLSSPPPGLLARGTMRAADGARADSAGTV